MTSVGDRTNLRSKPTVVVVARYVRDAWQGGKFRRFGVRDVTIVEPPNDYVDRATRACAQPDFEHRAKRCCPTPEECDMCLRNLPPGTIERRRGLLG